MYFRTQTYTATKLACEGCCPCTPNLVSFAQQVNSFTTTFGLFEPISRLHTKCLYIMCIFSSITMCSYVFVCLFVCILGMYLHQISVCNNNNNNNKMHKWALSVRNSQINATDLNSLINSTRNCINSHICVYYSQSNKLLAKIILLEEIRLKVRLLLDQPPYLKFLDPGLQCSKSVSTVHMTAISACLPQDTPNNWYEYVIGCSSSNWSSAA